ncbi:hypothetical protein BDB13_5713 [Rhodococcus sp. OK302]|nr:hypothetical protein BDB13_5713 [Rhodococcus sp. OK302]
MDNQEDAEIEPIIYPDNRIQRGSEDAFPLVMAM